MISNMTLRNISIFLQWAAGACLAAFFMVPDHPWWFAVLVTSLLVCSPLGNVIKGNVWSILRIGILLGGLTLLFQPELLQAASRTGPTDVVQTALYCLAGWLLVLGVLEDAHTTAFPLGMFSCLTSVLIHHPQGNAAYLVLAAAALGFSGGLIFINSLIRPRGTAAWGRAGRTVRGVLPQLLVAAAALTVMLISLDLTDKFSRKSRWLGPSEGNGNGSPRTCGLVRKAPVRSNNVVANVYAVRGNLPRYFADHFYYRYQSGQWLNGTPAARKPAWFYAGTKKASPPEGRRNLTRIFLQQPQSTIPVPYGTYQVTARTGQEDKTLQALRGQASTHWSVRTRTKKPPQENALDIRTVTSLRALVARVCPPQSSPREKVRRIKGFMRNNLRYNAETRFTMSRNAGADPVEHFLFQRKQGWCVHFASAATLLLRAANIPARMVTGYHVSSNTYMAKIRDKAGHAWAEALVPTARGRRWIIVDPSPPRATISKKGFDIAHIFLIIAIATVLGGTFYWLRRQSLSVRDLRRDLYAENGDRVDEVARIRAAYRRAVRFLERRNVSKPDSMPPRRFLQTRVPEPYQRDVQTIVTAFEKVTYMGHTTVGVLTEEVDCAQRRLLGAK